MGFFQHLYNHLIVDHVTCLGDQQGESVHTPGAVGQRVLTCNPASSLKPFAGKNIRGNDVKSTILKCLPLVVNILHVH